MKLAFSSNAYLSYPIEEAIRRVAAAGYQGIELLADVPHAWPAGLLHVQKQEILRTLEETGLTISNINAFMMNAVADPRQPYWHPSWTDPDTALSGHPARAYEAFVAVGRRSRCTAHYDRTRRAGVRRAIDRSRAGDLP